MVESERRKLAAAEAAEWWDRIVRDDLSAADRQAYADWLCESPVHVAEMICVERVHESLVHFENWGAIEVEATGVAPSGVVNIADRMPATRRDAARVLAAPSAEPPTHRTAAHKRVWTHWGAAAAAIALAVIGTVIGMMLRPGEETIRTVLAERREVTLQDGSVAQMDPDSVLRVRLESRQRLIFLERGRAVFHVAKNAERPFFVYSGPTSVRAVGTTFGVEQRSGDIVVTVAEGRVMVASERASAGSVAARGSTRVDAQPHPALYLDADQQVVVSGSGDAGPVHAVSGSRELAWAAGRLFFTDRPVADIVRDFNRYNGLQLQLEAPHLATQTVTGVFDASDPASFVAYLQAGLGAHATRTSPLLITLTE